jgi:hypothetical protein
MWSSRRHPKTCVGTNEERGRDVETERLASLDKQLELGGQLDRQVARLRAFENPASVNGDLTVRVHETVAVTGRPEQQTRETSYIAGLQANAMRCCLLVGKAP